MDIFEDDLDVVGNIQHAACVMGVTNTEGGKAQYRGRIKGSRNINRGPCSCFTDYSQLTSGLFSSKLPEGVSQTNQTVLETS